MPHLFFTVDDQELSVSELQDSSNSSQHSNENLEDGSGEVTEDDTLLPVRS